MKNRLSNLLCKNPSKWLFWLCIAFICRGVLFYLQIHIHLINDTKYIVPAGFWGDTMGDSGSYFVPIDNLVRNDSYSPDYRLPGYGILYLPLLLLFSQATALNLLIIIQYIFSALSVYCLALIAKYIFKKDTFFYLTFYLFLFSTYTSLYDNILMTESLATSMLIFSVFYFTLYLEKLKRRYLILSGLCMAWLIFLRPVFAPILVIMAGIFIFNAQKKILFILLFIPFAVFDGLWVARNYIIYHKFIPLNKSIYIYKPQNGYKGSVMSFCKAWGGVRTPEDDWMYPNNEPMHIKPHFPPEIFTSKFNLDSLKKVKDLLAIVLRDSATLSNAQLAVYEKQAKQKLDSYTLSIKSEKPFLYYVKAPMHTLLTFFHMPYYTMLYIDALTIRLSADYYYFTLFAGLAGILLMLPLLFKLTPPMLIPFIGIYTIVIHTIIFKTSENRYLVPAYPFIIMCAAYFIYLFTSKIARLRK